MPSTFITVRDKIKTKLEDISDIQVVETYPTTDFSGYPACAIYPNDQESDYQNVVQNERRYTFVVSVFYETTATENSIALDALFSLVDQILDSFDQDQQLSGISLPSGKMIIAVEPTTSTWGQVEDRKLLMTNINLVVRISSDMQ